MRCSESLCYWTHFDWTKRGQKPVKPSIAWSRLPLLSGSHQVQRSETTQLWQRNGLDSEAWTIALGGESMDPLTCEVIDANSRDRFIVLFRLVRALPFQPNRFDIPLRCCSYQYISAQQQQTSRVYSFGSGMFSQPPEIMRNILRKTGCK